MKKRLFLLVLILLFSMSLFSTIIIKQTKDGKIIITNTPDNPFYHKKKKSIKYIRNTNYIPFKYKKKIEELSKKYGVKKDLIIAVAKVESGFNPFAVSRKGAVGIMQLMKETADKYGISNRYDYEQNLEAGVKHLKELLKKYDNNLTLTLAAYNAGINAVEKYGGVPPFKETKNYIRKVMKILGMSYDLNAKKKTKTIIYKYKLPDGRIVISNNLPLNFKGEYKILE